MTGISRLPESVVVGSVQDFVDLLNLVDVRYYAISAELDESAPPVSPKALESFDTDWGVRIRHENDQFGVRLRSALHIGVGEIVVDLAAEYEAPCFFEAPSPEIVAEFVNNVAFMQLLPYVRETVSALTTKVLGQALLMPVVQRGEVQFSLDG